MKLHTAMPKSLTPYFENELRLYQLDLNAGKNNSAWLHLEKAHIIGQKFPYEHTLVHWKMLRFGIKIKSRKEIVGQIPRLIFGGIKSFVGTIPVGNPGGASVPPLKPFPISKDIQAIFTDSGIQVQNDFR